MRAKQRASLRHEGAVLHRSGAAKRPLAHVARAKAQLEQQVVFSMQDGMFDARHSLNHPQRMILHRY
jgi:hypothetical protein